MTTTGLQANNNDVIKETPLSCDITDSVKESISDIINQLQDIDPARLSFSPFLDLDTQISLAPVSDSPESSVEELRSSSQSVSGSQHSLEPQTASESGRKGELSTGPESVPRQPPSESSVDEQQRLQEGEEEEGVLDGTVSSPIATAAHDLEHAVENCISTPTPPASQRDTANGRDTTTGWSPESNNLESTVDEGHPLIGLAQESIELTMWSSPEETCEGVSPGVSGTRRCCSCCRCCQPGCAAALVSVLSSLLCTAGLLYALYFYVPIEAPDCPDVADRLTFTLRCCAVAAVPVVLGMLLAAVCQVCTGGGSEPGLPRRRPAVQQLFVTASVEQLAVYVLNLLVLATFLPPDQMRVVPILTGVFVAGRLIYWLSFHVCSSWRGFGSGLSVFPLLAMAAFNLFCLYEAAGLRQLLFGPEDSLYNQTNQTTPSSWPLEMMSQTLRDQ